MGRVKQSRPIKRRRVILEADDSVVAEEQTTLMEQQQQLLREGNRGKVGEEEELAKAIELLRKTPPDQVEAAAAEATRLDLTRNDRWIHLRLPEIPASSSRTKATTTAIVFCETDNSEGVQKSSSPKSNDNPSLMTTRLPKKSSPCDYETMDAVGDAATNNFQRSSILSSHIPSWSRGLGFARLAPEDFVALQKLHQVIKDRINRKTSERNNGASSSSSLEWASWSGSTDDPRKRAFGFLPGTWGYDPEIRNNQLDITMPKFDEEKSSANDERIRNKRAMLVLEKSEVPKGVEKAINNLCRHLRTCLLSKEKDYETMANNGSSDRDYRNRLAQFLHYEYMIAAQPNLQAGRALLPIHLDDPRKDGFGVVILTVGMKGAGTILLRDAKGIHRGVAMRLEAGDAYMLSDRARDACAHGVLADASMPTTNNDCDDLPFSERESLNLRFGLHDFAPPCSEGLASSLPIIPTSMVLQNWQG